MQIDGGPFDSLDMGRLDQFRSVKKGLNLQPADCDIQNLFPIFTPASFFQRGNWPGPYILPGAEGVGITWALNLPGGATRYLDEGMRTRWDAARVDWKATAMANLSDASKDRLYTHGLGRKTEGLFAVAMMHPDGQGPSRLLLVDALKQLFPEGYRVSLPEMSCGIAISSKLDEAEEAAIKEVIAKCFKDGTRPLAKGIFEPHEIAPNW